MATQQSERERLEAKFSLLMSRHLEARRSWMTAHRLPGLANAIEIVRARLWALDDERLAA